MTLRNTCPPGPYPHDLADIPAFLRRYKATEECLLCETECTGAWTECPVRKEANNDRRS